jgi:hypothetical protein
MRICYVRHLAALLFFTLTQSWCAEPVVKSELKKVTFPISDYTGSTLRWEDNTVFFDLKPHPKGFAGFLIFQVLDEEQKFVFKNKDPNGVPKALVYEKKILRADFANSFTPEQKANLKKIGDKLQKSKSVHCFA